MPTQKNFFRTYAAQSRPISCQDHCSYLPNLANLAQDIDSLAHKIRGVPSSLLHHALDGLVHDVKKLQASTRESLDALAEPSTVTAKNLEQLVEELETAGNFTGLENGTLPEMLGYLEGWRQSWRTLTLRSAFTASTRSAIWSGL